MSEFADRRHPRGRRHGAYGTRALDPQRLRAPPRGGHRRDQTRRPAAADDDVIRADDGHFAAGQVVRRILFEHRGQASFLLAGVMVERKALGGRGLNYLSRSDEHTSELQSLMRISYAVFCLKKKITIRRYNNYPN